LAVPETPAAQSRVPTPILVTPLPEPPPGRTTRKAPPRIEPSRPGSLGWVLPRLPAGFLLGGAAGYVLEKYRKALAVHDSSDRQDVLIALVLAWAVAGGLAALLGWFQESRARWAHSLPWLFFWLLGGALGGGALGWAGASAGFWVGGPMGLVYGLGALC